MESKQRGDVPAPVRISAEMNRRFPTAWRRFDEARAGRPVRRNQDPVTWLTHDEALSAFANIRDDQQLDTISIEAITDLYAIGTWRVTQGIYRFDDELLRALAETPLDISLPASLLTRLPEWAVYVETQGFRHHGKPIVGMIATLFDAPSGLSLMLTLIPQTVRSIDDDLDRLQFHLTETSLRERLLRDIGDHGTRSAEFRETLDELAKAGDVPHEKSRTSKRTFPTPHCPTCHACAPIRGPTVMSTVGRY